jgi:hypothetical protein
MSHCSNLPQVLEYTDDNRWRLIVFGTNKDGSRYVEDILEAFDLADLDVGPSITNLTVAPLEKLPFDWHAHVRNQAINLLLKDLLDAELALDAAQARLVDAEAWAQEAKVALLECLPPD